MRGFSRGITRSEEDKRRESLKNTYDELVGRLGDIRGNFDFTDDDSMIDALIYEENAVLCRLRQIILEAREQGIKLDFFER